MPVSLGQLEKNENIITFRINSLILNDLEVSSCAQ